MTRKLTRTQKALRPVLNYLVERFFPNGAFYGNDYLRTLKADTQLVEKWGSAEMACAMLIISRLRKQGAQEATLVAHDVTDKDVPVGSWRMTVERVDTKPVNPGGPMSTTVIEVLMGVGTREGQWLMRPDDRDHEKWCQSRSQALANAVRYAADHEGPVTLHVDQL